MGRGSRRRVSIDDVEGAYHLEGERLGDVALGHHREMFWAASMVEGRVADGTDCSRGPTASHAAAVSPQSAAGGWRSQ